MTLFYASLVGDSVDYSCGTLEGPWTDEQDAQDYCDARNSQLAHAGIPSANAFWIVE